MLGDLIIHTSKSILNAYSNQSNLTEDVLSVEGMSGNKTRHLYNNICNLNNANYLEIGTWKGSSFISAMYNNTNTKGYCVDNWVEFGGPKNEFYNNINKFLSTKSNKISCPKAANCAPSSIEKCANSEISAPATKAFSPDPVRIIALIVASASNCARASCNS